MPNQLANNKSRKSITEHKAVLAAVEKIARKKGITAMTLMRQALREVIKKHTGDSTENKDLRQIVMQFAPKSPKRFGTAAQLSRFKRSQREFDQVLLDLQLDSPENIETRNSAVSPKCKIRVLELEK